MMAAEKREKLREQIIKKEASRPADEARRAARLGLVEPVNPERRPDKIRLSWVIVEWTGEPGTCAYCGYREARQKVRDCGTAWRFCCTVCSA